MMSAASVTRFFTFSNELIYQKRLAIAYERRITKMICFSVTISKLFLTRFHLTMFIYTRISSR